MTTVPTPLDAALYPALRSERVWYRLGVVKVSVPELLDGYCMSSALLALKG